MTDSKPHSELKIGVVGAGSWGTALANLLAKKGYPIDQWVFEPEVKAQMAAQGENQLFLPGVKLSPNLTPSGDLAQVVSGKDLVLIVVPSHVMRHVAGEMEPRLNPGAILVSASKGIENTTHLTMTGILQEVLPQIRPARLAVLSGPSFAKEVAARAPTVVTAACRDEGVAQQVQQVFATPYFRVYTHTDVLGVELGGAVKNVIAIASGIIDGLGLGLNTRAALITRGLTEIRRLGINLGAQPRTFTGAAGIGDLILTCTGTLSRNYTVGKKIGQGMTLAQILGEMKMVAEGVKTARSVYNLSRKRGVEMPISQAIYRVLYEDLAPQQALQQLMTRDLKQELDED
ncbi:MAG: NAD(P)H-dependent glycerol-3-phosphate dehydrogenase [Desulfobacterales bacterium]